MRTGSIAAFITRPRNTKTTPGATIAGGRLRNAAPSAANSNVPARAAIIARPRNMKLAPTVLKMKYLKPSRRAAAVSSWQIAAHSAQELISSQKAKKLKMSLACVMPMRPAIITVKAAKKRPCRWLSAR